jgi:hypothetical protein
MARPRKKLIALLISLVVLVAVVVIADRVAAGIAEDKVGGLIADQASEHGVTSKKAPDVDITGFPFLTQVLGGEYSEIDITLTDLGSGDLTLPKLEIRATDVTAAFSDVMAGTGPITATHMEADGFVSYESLTKVLENLIDAEVTPEEGNTLGIAATVDVAGQPIDVAGKASVEFSDGVLSIQAQDFTADGVTLPPGSEGVLNGLAQQFSREVPIPPLPYDLKLAEPQFDKDAIVLSAAADNVPLA